MKFDTQSLTLFLVGLHLLGGALKGIFHTPKQAAQIDAVEAKVDEIGSQLATIAPSK